jgi:hypothetical protein
MTALDEERVTTLELLGAYHTAFGRDENLEHGELLARQACRFPGLPFVFKLDKYTGSM